MVRGSLKVKEVFDSFELDEPGCFRVKDLDSDWLMCAEDKVYIDNWACTLKILVGQKC